MKRPTPEEIESLLATQPEERQEDLRVRAEITFSLLCQYNSDRFEKEEAEDVEARFRDWLEDEELGADSAKLQAIFKKTIWWPGLRGDQVLDIYLVKYRLDTGEVGVGVVATDVHAFPELSAFELDPYRLIQLFAGWQAAKLAVEAEDYVCRDSEADRAKLTKKLEARGFRNIEFDRCTTINSRNYYDGTCEDAEGNSMVWGGSAIYCGGERADAPLASVPMSYIILGLELYGEEGLDNPAADQWGCSQQAMGVVVVTVLAVWCLWQAL